MIFNITFIINIFHTISSLRSTQKQDSNSQTLNEILIVQPLNHPSPLFYDCLRYLMLRLSVIIAHLLKVTSTKTDLKKFLSYFVKTPAWNLLSGSRWKLHRLKKKKNRYHCCKTFFRNSNKLECFSKTSLSDLV